jgi:catechol 2,3-dioxygenase-like lactoylglutathione lyase family enzyme
MEKVTGIGGVFFRARDPEALAAWYATHLGLGPGAGGAPWRQEAGFTVFAPFPADTDYFPADRAFMLNLRVADLDAMLAQLSAAGIAAQTRAEWDGPHGRFARIHDPEGNPVELWQPPAP